MNCRKVQLELIGYIENSLSDSEMAQVSDHLNSCADCNRLFKEVSATYTVAEKLSKPQISPFFYGKLEQRLMSEEKSKTIVPQVALRWMPVAASFLLLIAIGTGIFVGKNLSNTSTSKIDVAATTSVEAYASDYYLTDTGEESIESLLNYE